MLQQYGIATPSSVTPVSHPEDAQPNEVIKKRRGRGLPPRVATSASRSRGFHGYRGSGGRGSHPPRGSYRGSYRGVPSHQGDQYTQYDSREKPSWRGSSRGGPKSNQNSPVTYNAHWWSRQSEDKSPSTQGPPDRPSSTSTSTSRFFPTYDPRLEAHISTKQNYSSTSLPSSSSQDNHTNYTSTTTSSHWARGGREVAYQENSYYQNPPAMNWSHYDNAGSSRISSSSRSTPTESIDRHNPTTQYQSLPSMVPQMRSMHPPQGGHNYGHNQNPVAMDWSGLSSANMSSSKEPIRSGLPVSLNPATMLQPLQLMLPQLQFTLPSPSIVNWMTGLNELIPNLNQKPAPMPLSQQSNSVPATMHTDVDKPSSLSNDAGTEPVELNEGISTSSAGNAQSSMAKARPVLPTRKWMYRSKSPSPKLPDAPLKRRKLESDHDFSSTNSGSDTETVDHFPTIEAVSASVISANQRRKVPLPGRQKKSASVNREADPQQSSQHVVQEDRLPTSPHKTPPTHVAPTETKMKTSAVKDGSVVPIPTTPSKNERHPQSPTVKKEYISPTPPSPIKPQRRLVRESVNFYPIPESCVKTHPQYRENRRAFFQEHNKALIKLGLKKTKAFFRDDGLVIEWTSPVPVWSDTLEPEIPNLASAMQEFIAKSPQRTPKRRREGSLANNLSSKRETTEGPDPPLSTPSKRRRKETKPQKHWAAGFSMDEIDRMAICISPSPPPKPSLPPKSRPPLPTRLHHNAPNSNSNSMIKPEATPSAPVLKYDERVASTRDKEAHPTRLSQEPAPKRMIFKPTNPRRKVQTAPVVCVMSSGAEGSGGSMQTPVDAQVPPADALFQVERGLGDSSASPFQPSQLSFRSPSTELPTAVRLSPTTVDESAWPKPSRPQVVGPTDDDGRPMGDDASSWNVCATTESAEEVAKDLLENYSDDGPSDVINSADEDEDIESNLALEFFSRFITLFDSDRSKLEMAYAKDALFSCRVHHLQENDFSMAGQFAPELKPSFLSSHCRATASAVEQGRSRICDRLRSLGPHKFRAQPGSVVWDMAPLPVGAQGHLMFSVHGEVVHPSQAGPHLDHVLTVDQTFVLRPRTAEDEGDDNEITGLNETEPEDIWPLVSISHQMTVREARLLSAETMGNLLPWAQSIQSGNEDFDVEDTLRLG